MLQPLISTTLSHGMRQLAVARCALCHVVWLLAMASGQNSVQVSYGVVNYQKNTVHRGPTQEWTREASFRPQGQGLLTAYTLWVTPPQATMWLLLTKAQ